MWKSTSADSRVNSRGVFRTLLKVCDGVFCENSSFTGFDLHSFYKNIFGANWHEDHTIIMRYLQNINNENFNYKNFNALNN